jgi:hypothetical protein
MDSGSVEEMPPPPPPVDQVEDEEMTTMDKVWVILGLLGRLKLFSKLFDV